MIHSVAMKRLIEERVKLLVPPRSGAVVNKTDKASEMERNKSILQIIGLRNDDEAIKLWKRLTRYHKRSLVETTFSRLKGTFGGKLFSKSINNQNVELLLKAHVMNEMTRMGMPKGEMI